jgi:hypothetical protein
MSWFNCFTIPAGLVIRVVRTLVCLKFAIKGIFETYIIVINGNIHSDGVRLYSTHRCERQWRDMTKKVTSLFLQTKELVERTTLVKNIHPLDATKLLLLPNLEANMESFFELI